MNTITIKNTTLHVGDSVKIGYQFKEAGKQKEQKFAGILIKIRGAGNNKMFTVRKMTKDQIGVERIFPVISPLISQVAVVKKGTARRAKLYFIRGRSEQELRAKLS